MENERIYSRQDGLPLTRIEEAIIVGLGGSGSNVAKELVLSGCQRLHLMDSDVLEVSNLNRVPLPKSEVGQPKTEAMKRWLLALRPEIEVNTYPNADDFTLQLVAGEVLFDCTDRARIQRELGRFALSRGMRYIRCSYNGTHMTVTETNSEWATQGTPDGYDIVPSWSVPTVIAAALGIAKAMYRPKLEVCHDLSELYDSPTGEPIHRGLRDIDLQALHSAFEEVLHESDDLDDDGDPEEDGYDVDREEVGNIDWEATLRDALEITIRREAARRARHG